MLQVTLRTIGFTITYQTKFSGLDGLLVLFQKLVLRVSSGSPTREIISIHEAAGLVVLLFSRVWKPDETRNPSF